jgi:magnesium transporter
MIQYFLSSTNNLMEIPDVEKGCWVMLIAPTEEEILHISKSCEVDPDFIRAALDE